MLFECNFKFALLVQFIEISDAILADLIFICPACAIIEGQFNIHEYLVDVECCAFFVNHDRFSELSVLTYSNRAFPYDVYVKAVLIAVLNYFAAVTSLMSKAYHKVADKVLLTPVEQRLQFFDKRTKECLDD